jgi:hypothetical protein
VSRRRWVLSVVALMACGEPTRAVLRDGGAARDVTDGGADPRAGAAQAAQTKDWPNCIAPIWGLLNTPRGAPEHDTIKLKARKRGAGWVTLWDHALDRDRGFFFFPFKNPRNSYSAQAQQRLPAAVVQDAAVDLANKLCVRKDAGAPG